MPIYNLPEELTISPLLTPRRAWQFLYRPQVFHPLLRDRSGPLVNLKTQYANLILALKPDRVRQVLTQHPKNYESFQKESLVGIFGDRSVFTVDGEDHTRLRRLLSPPFQSQRVRLHAEAIRGIIASHLEDWHPGREIRAEPLMLDLARDIIMQVVFGRDFEEFRDEGRVRLAEMYASEHPWNFYIPWTQAWWSLPWRRFKQAKQKLFVYLAALVAARRSSGRGDDDILGRLLSARDSDGERLPEAQILQELYALLLAGHASTGVAIAWVLYELARNSAVMKSVREEQRALGTAPDPVEMAGQPYLDAVCKEAMRLHVNFTETARLTTCPIDLGDYQVPEGYGMGVSITAVHGDPEIYPDPERFRPERFLEREHGPFEFLPFGGGHRRCLGAPLAEFEIRLAVAMIISRWSLELIKVEQESRHDLGVRSRYGVQLRLTEPG